MKNNNLLVEFEFIVNLDIAMYKYLYFEYNIDIINGRSYEQLVYDLLNRTNENPLEISFSDEYDTSKLYKQILEDKETLLRYAIAYDTFGLMITFINKASVDITVLCESQLEADYIKKLNPVLNTLISSKEDVDISNYTVLYVKYLDSLSKYNNLYGKHIYISTARYNMEPDKDYVNKKVCLYTDVNEVHLIDLYTNIKFRYLKREENTEQ